MSGFFLMIPVQEPKREFQSEHLESRRPEGREGNRQRRKRELIFGLLWDIDFLWFLLVPVLVPCSFTLFYSTNYIKIKDLNCLDLSYLDCFFCHGVPDVACDHVFLRSFVFPGKNMSWAAGGRVTEPICCRRRCHTEDFHGTLLADSNLCGSLSGWMKACGPQGILKKVTFHQRARRLRDSA